MHVLSSRHGLLCKLFWELPPRMRFYECVGGDEYLLSQMLLKELLFASVHLQDHQCSLVGAPIYNRNMLRFI